MAFVAPTSAPVRAAAVHGTTALTQAARPPLRIPRSTQRQRRRRAFPAVVSSAAPAEPAKPELISSASRVHWFASPVPLCGLVQRGFGRGSRDLGFPTANLPGSLLSGVDTTARDGVYVGFGVVPTQSRAPAKVVANVGRNQTFGDVPDRVLEAYVMDESLDGEFYGQEMRLVLVGFLRGEVKFDGIGPLIANIRNDVAVAEALLDDPLVAHFASHPSLSGTMHST
jgi:FAD synthase